MPTKHRAALLGAGPAGFYTAAALLKAGLAVDLYDALPTPYGLVRAGVAPDHPKIKTVTRTYDKTAAHEDFRFFGRVKLGEDVSREDLLARYHAIVYAVGTRLDNRLGIPGEDLPGSHAATEFVAWYNGHPDYADREFDLSCERAVVIGNGNVAIDVARMLALDPDELAVTDTADHAIDALSRAQVKEVVMLGRRGPAQAAFTNPELRELKDLQRAHVVVDPGDVELDEHSSAWLDGDEAHTTARRNVEILREFCDRDPGDHVHRIVMRFLRSPVEILGEERVKGVRVAVNQLQPGDDGRLRAVITGETEVIECGLVLRSIGYRGEPIDGVPFDERSGLIPNAGGRVTGDDGEPLPGEYAVGWIKRGPSGVIGTNKKDAADTVARILEDRDAGALNDPAEDGDAEAWLREHVPQLVTWEGWERIDAHERRLGEPLGRPRVKIVDLEEMGRIASGG
ncbi:MAG: FAD-dependent oxidoreductase [Solirubrobacterales bacterium]|nr:FAD-dependent oxidoreductase [Solirubrobacterales bacterium]